MTPGKIEGADAALGAPSGWDEAAHGRCDVLYVRRRNGYMESVWLPTEEEKQAIAEGKPVTLTVWGDTHPPVSLNVEAQ